MSEQPALGFAGLLRQLRAQARLTQEELAEAAGVSPRSVSDLERGINRTARKDTAELLAAALGLAEPVRPLFVAAARGRIPAAEVLAAMQGEAPGRGPAWPGCPYLGLVPFQERDARFFYGRDELVAQLVQRLLARLDKTGMLLVAGESGAGKSSLLRAGLMPRLAAGALGPGSQRWPRRVIRPTGSPLRELAIHLAEVAGADPVSVYRSLLAAPGEAPMLVEQAVRTAAIRVADTGSGSPADAAAAAPPRLVPVIDQFEEMFTAGGDVEDDRVEREAFVAALHAAVRQRNQAVYNQVIAEALQFGTSDTPLAAQLNLAAYRIQPTQDLASRLLNTENTPLSSPLATDAGAVNSVAFSSDGHTLASGSDDGSVRLWDVADPAHPRPLSQPLTGTGIAAVNSVAFSSDGHTLASGDANGTVRLWDVADPAHPSPRGQPLTSGGTAPVDSVAFSPDGHTLASGSDDGVVQLWDVADPAHPSPLGQPLTGGTATVNSVAFSSDGHTLASGSGDGTTRLWNLNVQYAIGRICATAGGLTPRQWNEYIPQLRYQASCVH